MISRHFGALVSAVLPVLLLFAASFFGLQSHAWADGAEAPPPSLPYPAAGPNAGAGSTVATAAGVAPPNAPRGLAAAAISSSSIYVVWNSPSGGGPVSNYLVYRYNSSARVWIEFASPGSGTLSAVDVRLQSNTLYYYDVCSYNAAGTICAPYTSARTYPDKSSRQTATHNTVPDSNQCTYYVVEKMHAATGLWLPPLGTQAGNWGITAKAAGWTVGSKPETAAILVMPYANNFQYWYYDTSTAKWRQTHVNNPNGHVAWVDNVSADGTMVHVTDRNFWKYGQDSDRWFYLVGAPVSYIYSSH